MGKAWGLGCESCPSHGGSEYKAMCGSGPPGVMVNPMTNQTEEIDECQLMPGTTLRIMFISIFYIPISDLNASNTFSYMPVQRYVPTWEMYQHDGKFQMRLQAGI